jgi:hypothetical protein
MARLGDGAFSNISSTVSGVRGAGDAGSDSDGSPEIEPVPVSGVRGAGDAGSDSDGSPEIEPVPVSG